MRAALGCQFCGEQTRVHDLRDAAGIQLLAGLYLAHLIESHWELLGQLREWRVAQGGSYDSWKRL